jgi:molecular chaperone DnaK (HSP70)
MKHIIKHYRWLLEQNEKLAEYAKSLEKKIDDLEHKITEKAEKNIFLVEKHTQRNRENKRLKARIEWLESKLGKSEGEGAKD